MCLSAASGYPHGGTWYDGWGVRQEVGWLLVALRDLSGPFFQENFSFWLVPFLAD